MLLRVLSVVAVVLGILLVVIACFDPTKSAIDVLARGLLWAIVSLIAWAVADVREKIG